MNYQIKSSHILSSTSDEVYNEQRDTRDWTLKLLLLLLLLLYFLERFHLLQFLLITDCPKFAQLTFQKFSFGLASLTLKILRELSNKVIIDPV